MENLTNDYYLKNEKRFIGDADAFMLLFQHAAEKQFSQDTASITEQARERFKILLPKLPYIGGDENFLTQNLISGAIMLCVYQVMKSMGYKKELI